MARVAARNAREPGTGWTPVTGRLGTRCRMGRRGAPLRVAPCTGIVTCFTVRESRSRAASFAISLAVRCGHRVWGLTANKATRPPSGSAKATGRLLPAPSLRVRKWGLCMASGRLPHRPCTAAPYDPGPGTGWTPVTGRLATRCRMGRLGALFWLAPCAGILACLTVRESRSRAASFAISLAVRCGHRVSGCTMNKAMRPPPGSATDAVAHPQKGRTAHSP